MDGCSFGVGMPNSNGDVLVGHSNAQNKATGTNFNPNFGPQRTAQLQDLVTGGAGQAIVEPAAYRDNLPLGAEYKAVTVGLRINGTWGFWYQHRNVDGTALRDLIGVTKL
jgi:hypothetical protein